ncbi:D,D-heptose 1,7-bisphosphate phosphatase [Izhakiella australiensis]|uniref:D,D-heptose 1,7-bisphosphate phosphatase n=1 Tax=Izhakiella australiensis TaxID=1926881 RepID=A0A1S8Y949_9GAMM|nr:HAD family hydrolase [Izhakiella australiensis]OON35651.1 D,D-heptose 1,7-bisphosphate phosphatase [Izhakiella australiensis]
MKVAFLDRDGVINNEIDYLFKIEDFSFTSNCIKGLQRIIAKGYEIVVVTNQAGIARGYYTVSQYYELTAWYRAELRRYGINLLDVFYCPHHPNGVVPEYSIDCVCRKPNAGMLEAAASKYQIDKDQSFLVGDKVSDLEAGINFGLNKVYLVETGHQISEDDYNLYQVYPDLLSIPL